jgi:hypothetical protein
MISDLVLTGRILATILGIGKSRRELARGSNDENRQAPAGNDQLRQDADRA